MDTQTLLVMNVLFFALYAGVMLANARIVGGERGAWWFAGSNLSRGAATLLVAAAGWWGVSPRILESLTGLLAVSGLMMLHRSFAELLERGPLLRWAQHALLGAMAAGTIYLLWRPPTRPVFTVFLCVILGVQCAVIASVVFRFSGEDVGTAGWLTGAALMLYTVILLMRAMVTLRYTAPEYERVVKEMERIWLMGGLLTNGAVAFGYMFLSAAKARQELLWRAQVDELTGLLNRWALKRVATREILLCRRAKSSLAMVMMDLDGLKAVNDAFGHGCGDVVLQAVGGVLQETVREGDSVARMGGDEFCVLLPDTEVAEALTVAERLRAEVDALVIRYRGDTVRIRTSLGVVSSDRCELSWQSLMDCSDAALYRAKREGKNQVALAEGVVHEVEQMMMMEEPRRVEDGE
jgi:diguanylate cyclase (GGDEF)-like protein